MRWRIVLRAGILAPLFCCLVVFSARAQIETNLSAYTGKNAEGYLNPLKDALGVALNSGLFRSAAIPAEDGFTISVELKTMLVTFGDDDDTFTAETEYGFLPVSEVTAPTLVGSTQAVQVPGQAGTQAIFPGGLDVSSTGLAVPQITVGTFAGTQLVARYVAFKTGDVEIGDLSLFGIGARHSISQYLEAPPVDLAAAVMYQTFNLGDSFIETSALSFGVQASRQFSVLEPYAGLAFDTFDMSVDYESDSTTPPTQLKVDFDKGNSAHFAAGLGLNLSVLHLTAGVDLSSQTSYTFGLSVGR